MAIYRTQHTRNYTIINNVIVKDNRLSWKAKGILLYAFSRPDGWQFYLEDLIKQSTDGRDSVQAGLKELHECGYLKRSQFRNADGTYNKETEWIFYETPLTDEFQPKTDFPLTEKPLTENPPLPNTDPVPIPEKQQQSKTESAVAVSLSLEKIDIPLDEKIWLTKNYSEETIRHAVEFSTHPLTTINTSLLQTIKWACKKNPQIPVDEAAESLKRKDEEREYFLKNKLLAEELATNYYNKTKDAYAVRLSIDYVELDLDGRGHSVKIYYGDKNFKQLIGHELTKKGFVK